MDTSEYIVNYRKNKKLSQSQFSKLFNIPISTLRKWEQKESNPSKYFIQMLLNEDKEGKQFVSFENEEVKYLYDFHNSIVYDKLNTGIKINYDIRKISKDNIIQMLDQLFNDYYKLVDKFEIQCSIDEEQKGKWHRLK